MTPIKAMADTGFLVSFYSADANSLAAVSAVQRHVNGAIAFTELHRLEFFNAMRLRVFRQQITEVQMEQSLSEWQNDLNQGILREVPLDLGEVYRRARLLSASHTRKTGARSLDLLHVAAALELRLKTFYTFDSRQRRVAAAEKLTVKP